MDNSKEIICVSRNIAVIDENNFELRNRNSVVEYLRLTGDNPGFIKSIKGLITGKMELNGKQIENYQKEYCLTTLNTEENRKLLRYSWLI